MTSIGTVNPIAHVEYRPRATLNSVVVRRTQRVDGKGAIGREGGSSLKLMRRAAVTFEQNLSRTGRQVSPSATLKSLPEFRGFLARWQGVERLVPKVDHDLVGEHFAH